MQIEGEEYIETDNPSQNFVDQQYFTNINQLIAQPQMPSKTEKFLSSIYNLSLYLFQKKVQTNSQEQEISFDGYLNSVSDQITVYDNLHKKSKQLLLKAAQFSLNNNNKSQSELVECFRRVPFLYFQQKFILDFGDLSKNSQQVQNKQEQLNDDLDLVDINLFTQIHYKFHDYFSVVTNFDYLGESIVVNIQKIKQSRVRMQKVRVDFIEKSALLRKKIIQRQNLQKTIKLLKITKSLKKLPTIINEVLMSSLPYQCLSLLKSTKQSLSQVNGLTCLTKTSNLIAQSQNLVQMGLNKRYADQLYLYLEQCQNINMQDQWQRINSHNCMDVSGINNSIVNTSTILEQSFLDMQPTCNKNKRNQGKQYQIAMIVIQSYKYIQFPQDLTRIKISNSLRIFLKKFDQELAKCLHQILLHKGKNMILNESMDEIQQSTIQNNQYILNTQLVEKVTVVFYIKHLYILNQIMKETLNRLLGFLKTLLTEYEDSDGKDQGKFIGFFKEELTSVISICKITVEKVRSLMMMKNISGIGLQEFKQWIAVLEYWDKYTDNLIQDHELINYDGNIKQLQKIINQSLRKMVSIMNIKSTISQLSYNFVTSYHQNVVNTELQTSLIDQSWQSVEIPGQFTEVINNISQWNDSNLSQNISITILNQSGGDLNNSKNRSFSSSFSSSHSQDHGKKIITKFRVLKNNVLVDGNRYKVSVSFLLLCQFIDQYIKMAKSLSCHKFIYQRMFDLIDNYNTKTKQLILQAKARQYQKMKSKNISAKHLCLVHNCLTLLQKLLKEFKKSQTNDLKQIALTTIQIHRKKIIQKLSVLLRGKVESTINNYFNSLGTNKQQKNSQVSLTILNTMVQMMNIVDQYLQFDDRKIIFQESMAIFVSKYFKQLLLKGKQQLNQNKMLLQKLVFLKQYFPEQLEIMDQQLIKIEKS